MKKKKIINRLFVLIMVTTIVVFMAGCGQEPEKKSINKAQSRAGTEDAAATAVPADLSPGELEVRFGDEGAPFMLKLNGSETAAAIARYVGSSDWRLPIYEDDEDADYDVLQYYDIPDQYEIPSAPQKVSTVKAGEAYYSHPNRIVLFYQDAEVSEEYTPIGSFDATKEFVEAVRDNPVLEGWGNKIVLLKKP